MLWYLQTYHFIVIRLGEVCCCADRSVLILMCVLSEKTEVKLRASSIKSHW